jgi:hypothetical protein
MVSPIFPHRHRLAAHRDSSVNQRQDSRWYGKHEQVMVTSERFSTQGIVYDISVMDRDDPKLAGMQLPTESNLRTTSS